MTETLRKPTVLIVDDDHWFVELLTEELSPHFVIESAADGRTALDAIIRQSPDAIFLDHRLPDGEGVALIDEFRKRGCGAPVIILTASQDIGVAAAAMRAGAVDFVVKSADQHFYEDIVPTAMRAIEKWNNEKELEYLREEQVEQARRTSRLNHQLRLKNEQLQRAFAQVEDSHRQLDVKNRRLSELYETAHRFVDNVSHEMRTPLTVIREFVSIVLDGLAGPTTPQQAEYLGIAMAKTNDLAQMVDDMLDISKIEAGLLRVSRRRCTARDILAGVLPVLAQKAASSQVQLDVEAGDLPAVYCDPEKIGRVLINLVVNALKFSSAGSTVHLRAADHPADGEIRFAVQDHGPGIAPEHQRIIFERFRQVGTSPRANSSTRGFGLGLNIVKELLQFNLGEVYIDSRPGAGSTFSFSVPHDDPPRVLQRYLQRLPAFGCEGSHVAVVKVSAAVPDRVGPGILDHIHGFVTHHLSPFDLTFQREHAADLLIVTVSDEPDAFIQRLRVANREELRMSPGSTIDLSFEVLQHWPADGEPAALAESLAALLHCTKESSDALPQSTDH